MSDPSFDTRVDETLLAIEEAVDESGADIDYDTIAGILTLEFPNQTKIIINRQGATEQLWIAAKSGGYHLDWKTGVWFCQTEESGLESLLNRLCTDQLGEDVRLKIGVS